MNDERNPPRLDANNVSPLAVEEAFISEFGSLVTNGFPFQYKKIAIQNRFW